MEIIEHMFWCHDMKFENNPYTGDPNRFTRDINHMNEEQREAWRAVYDPINEAFLEKIPEERYESFFQEPPRTFSLDFLKNTPEGRELARFMFHRYLRDYLKTSKSIDDGVGEVLDYLGENGLLENTVVIYTSDQGFYLGEHGWFDKRFMYEQSLSTPLLMRYPKEIQPGTEINEIVLNLDLAPTFLDYAGLDKPDDMQGESFRSLVAGEEVDDWRDAMYYHYYEYPSVHIMEIQMN